MRIFLAKTGRDYKTIANPRIELLNYNLKEKLI